MNNNLKIYKVKNKEYKIYFVPKEKIAPAFGQAFPYEKKGGYAEVRNDLNPIVKRFVTEHELYHLTDNSKWLGRLGMEIRANIIPGIKNPIGFIYTIIYTIFSKERIKLYYEMIFKKSHMK